MYLIHIQIEKNTLYKVLEKKKNKYRDVGDIEEREKRSHLTRRWEGEDMYGQYSLFVVLETFWMLGNVDGQITEIVVYMMRYISLIIP